VIPDAESLKTAIASGEVHVVCQTEMVLNSSFMDPEAVNEDCRAKKVGYIST